VAASRVGNKQWDGQVSPVGQDLYTDLFLGPGGVEAWAYAAPTKEDLAAYTRTVIQASNAVHQCPAVTQSSQASRSAGHPPACWPFNVRPGVLRHSPADWMMHRRVGAATPELEHLRDGVALCRPGVSCKYSAGICNCSN
jgi:hypothetical protein